MHPEMGEGVIVGLEPTGFVRVYFLNVGERQVPSQALRSAPDWADRVIAGMRPATAERLERLWLAATASGISLHPMSQPLEAPEIKGRLAAMIPADSQKRVVQQTFRLGYAAPAGGPSNRRPLETVLIKN